MGAGFGDYPYKVGWCEICSQDYLTIAKEVDTARLVIVCDECDNEYNNPVDVFEGRPLRQPTSTGRCEPPSMDEVVAAGWDFIFCDALHPPCCITQQKKGAITSRENTFVEVQKCQD